MLYDARRPFEDRLFGPEPRVELLIATVPAASLLRSVPEAERLCAKPIPLSGTVARAIAALVRDAISVPDAPARQSEPDIVAYLSAILRLAAGAGHELSRPGLFRLIDTYLRANIRHDPAGACACRRVRHFGADLPSYLRRPCEPRSNGMSLHLRVELFRNLLRQASLSDVPIARLSASVRLRRRRPWIAHLQGEIWRHRAGLSARARIAPGREG